MSQQKPACDQLFDFCSEPKDKSKKKKGGGILILSASWGKKRLHTNVLLWPPSFPQTASHLPVGFPWTLLRCLLLHRLSLIYSEWLLNGTLSCFADIVSSHQFCMSSLSQRRASHTRQTGLCAPAPTAACGHTGSILSCICLHLSVRFCVCFCGRLCLCTQVWTIASPVSSADLRCDITALI